MQVRAIGAGEGAGRKRFVRPKRMTARCCVLEFCTECKFLRLCCGARMPKSCRAVRSPVLAMSQDGCSAIASTDSERPQPNHVL